ncbi:MAG: hypothetical protein K0S46_527 [Moraxellaceae bacterium]|jgi:hypothetical protein|nr:hypothetical protein [Moraxellaceae bacterium]
MKRFVWVAALAAVVTIPADGELPVPVGKPGGHGAIDVRSFPRPQLVSQHPVIIRLMSVEALARALYLYVPQAHRVRWARYCHLYKACSHPVYFVTDKWYQSVYVPEHEEELRRRAISRQRNPLQHRGVEF